MKVFFLSSQNQWYFIFMDAFFKQSTHMWDIFVDLPIYKSVHNTIQNSSSPQFSNLFLASQVSYFNAFTHIELILLISSILYTYCLKKLYLTKKLPG